MNQTRLHLIKTLPKTELHLHIEGTPMPEMMFALPENAVALPYASVAEVAAAYVFDDLQSFLNLYYEASMAVLQHRQDFYDLTMAYLQRMADEAVVHVEIFFDPQAHTRRGVSFETVIGGITDAQGWPGSPGDQLPVDYVLPARFGRGRSPGHLAGRPAIFGTYRWCGPRLGRGGVPARKRFRRFTKWPRMPA
ncbi:MAG: hypothetical protein R2857_02345 [Vampirovibrionales bacterium]